MRKRRKNQPPMDSLPLLAKFLSHASIQEDIPQSTIARKLQTSTASVSRWFHGSASPSDKELKQIAKVFNIPVENFYALRILDSMGPDKPMMAGVAAFNFMAAPPNNTLSLSGLTMLAGILQLRMIDLRSKHLRINLLNPLCREAKKFEMNLYKINTESTALSWLTSVSVLGAKSRQNIGSIKLWIRDDLHITKQLGIGELVSNNWIAAVSPPRHKNPKPTVFFYNDDNWKMLIKPYLDQLSEKSSNSNMKLIFDSTAKNLGFRNRELSRIVKTVLKKIRDKNIFWKT